MSCEVYNNLTDYCLLRITAEPTCRHEEGCLKTTDSCKWGPMFRAIARNMAIEDTPEDLEQDKALAELEAQRAISAG